MFWWAGNDLTLAQSTNADVMALLTRLRPSLAILGDARRPTGAAALVDAGKGLFLAHGDAVQGDTIQARVNDWSVSLRVVGSDSRTGLVVLALRSNSPAGLGPALSVADVDPVSGTKVCLVFAEGGQPGTFFGGQQFVLSKEKVAVPVSEVRFENPQQFVGGALLVSFEGKLLGAMGATVARPGNSSAVPLRALADMQRELSARGAFAQGIRGPQFNPGPLTVAYAPTVSLVRRSVSGLISDGHRPEYAVLGVLVGDGPGGGAVVRRVVADSPASKGGLQVGDVILAIGDRSIKGQFDFIQSLFAYRPGEVAAVRFRHDGSERRVEVALARSK